MQFSPGEIMHVGHEKNILKQGLRKATPNPIVNPNYNPIQPRPKPNSRPESNQIRVLNENKCRAYANSSNPYLV